VAACAVEHTNAAEEAAAAEGVRRAVKLHRVRDVMVRHRHMHMGKAYDEEEAR
jgi:hypothetical protein